MSSKQRLELTWIGKEKRPKLEPRILLEDPEKSYHAKARVTDNDIFDNKLIFGDNLLALKALEQEFSGKVKCIYIDPPYNTGKAFKKYDDAQEHSIWLSLMRDRLAILWRLLMPSNGTLLISINDDEAHYLKVLCDEMFGRKSFVASLIWNYEGNTDNQAKIINYHEYILVYSKTGDVDDPYVIDPNVSESSKLYKPEIRNTIVKNGSKNPLVRVHISAGFPANFDSGDILASAVNYPQYSSNLKIKNGKLVSAVDAISGWSSRAILEGFIHSGFKPVEDSKGQKTVFELTRTGAIEAVKVRNQTKGHFISVLRGFGTTNQMRISLEKIGLSFDFPKPVGLIAHLIRAFSGEDDWILDSFAGSGTTGQAVMNVNKEDGTRRKFILIELNQDTANNVIIPRMRALIDGNKEAGFQQHGGGFRYYRLAPSLLEKDRWDNWVIAKDYNAAMLAEAICKLMGFTYAPSESHYWMHGHSSETDYIYVTTQSLTHEQIAAISEEVGEARSLLVCCKAFNANSDAFQNLTVKKIPQAVLRKCEWGKDDYSLKVENLPMSAPAPTPEAKPARHVKASTAQPSLFSEEV